MGIHLLLKAKKYGGQVPATFSGDEDGGGS